MRLIDADKLKEDILKTYGCFEGIDEIIDAQSSVYDLDAVINSLKDLRDGVIEMDCCPNTKDTYVSCESCYMDKAIEIVKNGGRICGEGSI